MEMTQIRVGEKYPLPYSGNSSGGQIDFSVNGMVITFFISNPSYAEIDGFENGDVEVGYVELPHAMLFAIKMGFLVVDAPYFPYDKERYLADDFEPNMGIAMTAILVDADTGIVKHLRVVGLGHDFSNDFNTSYKNYCKLTYKDKLYHKSINDAYYIYPSTADVLLNAVTSYKLETKKEA